jgi:hypothetical protein
MVSVLVSVADSYATKPLPLKRFGMEAEVGIEPNQRLYQKPRCHSKVLARTQDTNTTVLTLRKSQILALESSLGINHLKLYNYSGITPLLLRCWQSNTQKILPL